MAGRSHGRISGHRPSESVTALLPIGLLAISKLIIDNIVGVVAHHQPVPASLWWLVGAEFALAACSSMLTRVVDYLDSLLADKYTRHVSIEVMRHAAGLDLAAYEDPVFYDRLERARVQATDRLGMIQSLGRLLQQVVTTLSLSISIVYFSPWLLLLLIGGSCPGVSGRESLCISGVRQEFPADSHPTTEPRLPAHPGGQQGGGEGAEAIRSRQLSYRAIHPALQ